MARSTGQGRYGRSPATQFSEMPPCSTPNATLPLGLRTGPGSRRGSAGFRLGSAHTAIGRSVSCSSATTRRCAKTLGDAGPYRRATSAVPEPRDSAGPAAGSISASSGRGRPVDGAIDQGADLVIVNRSGRQEREGKGLVHLDRARSAPIFRS